MRPRSLYVLAFYVISNIVHCYNVVAQDNIIARFTPLKKNEALEYSLDEHKFTLLKKNPTGGRETIYTSTKVQSVKKIGNNLIFSIDPGGIYRGYISNLIVGSEGEIRNIGNEHDVELFNDFVLFLRYQGLDAPDYPVIEVYSIRENKVIYSVSLTKYAQNCLAETWRQRLLVDIINEAKINYARIAFLAEETSVMDVYLDITTKKIKILCNRNSNKKTNQKSEIKMY